MKFPTPNHPDHTLAMYNEENLLWITITINLLSHVILSRWQGVG